MFLLIILLIVSIIELIRYLCKVRNVYIENYLTEKVINRKQEVILEKIDEEMFIPKNIIQTYKSKKEVPKYVFDSISSQIDESWKYHFFDDYQARDFLKEEYGEKILNKFDEFKKGAHKADLFRLCWLYKNGGVYIDIDTEILEPIDKILENMGEKLLTMPLTETEYGYKRLLNCFIVSNKGNPIILDCINNLINIKQEELDKDYHLILNVMKETIGAKMEYIFTEKNVSTIPYGEDWNIYGKNNLKIARSTYKDYDQKRGFLD